MSIFILSVIVFGSCSHQKNVAKSDEKRLSLTSPLSQKDVDEVTATWPLASKAAIIRLTEKYGVPNSVTPNMVIWYNTLPFKQSVVYREQLTHHFPLEHFDVLQQTINYKVPLGKVVALTKFDGSMVIDKTKGELSARNDVEELNILAFNLADKIVKDLMTVEQARREYRKRSQDFLTGTTSPILTSLDFKLEKDTNDPDVMMQAQEEKLKDTKSTPKIPESREVIDILDEEEED